MNEPIASLKEMLGWSEHGIVQEPIFNPEWDQIERNVFGYQCPDEAEGENREKAIQTIIRLKSWDFQNGMKDPHGLMIRSAVSAWAVVPLLEPLNLTQLAEGLGLKKQSLGRWVDQFKRDFPNIRNKHMR